MPWKPDSGRLPPPDPSLNTFRDAVGRLTFEGRTVGYIAFRVDYKSSLERGHLWWRQWIAPGEVVKWMQTMVDTDPTDIANMCEGLVDPDNEWLLAVRGGTVDEFRHHLPPHRYEVVWLTGREYDYAWEKYGFATAK